MTYRPPAKHAGKARSELIALIRRQVADFGTGRSPTQCMREIADAVSAYDRRRPQQQSSNMEGHR